MSKSSMFHELSLRIVKFFFFSFSENFTNPNYLIHNFLMIGFFFFTFLCNGNFKFEEMRTKIKLHCV